MDQWELWIGAISLAGLVFSTTLALALRDPSRARLTELFSRRGQNESATDALFAARTDYLMATSVIRSAFVLVLFGSVFHFVNELSTSLMVRTVLAAVVAFGLLVVFGVGIPIAWAKYAGEALIVRMRPALGVARIICYPALVVLGAFDPVMRLILGAPVRDARSYMEELEQEILDVVSEGERQGAVDEEEKEMIESVIEMGDTTVEEIMTPRTEIIALPRDANYDLVLETIRTTGHSRIPIYADTIDTVLGVLFAKDLLHRPKDEPFEVTKVMRKGFFVPETKPVRELLREFQRQGLHMAVVLDEYGGTAGLVSIEDILEELVGEITDEYEPMPPPELEWLNEHTVEVDARVPIAELNDQLPIDLPDEGDYDTLGGFVFGTLGRIPDVGERLVHNNVTVEVVATEPRRILRLRLHLGPTAEASESPTTQDAPEPSRTR